MQHTTQKRIVIIGRLPPPTGGVTTSIANLKTALESRRDVSSNVWPWPLLWRLPIVRPDIVHFHFLHPLKRIIATLIGRCAGAKVVHTIHETQFDFKDWRNRMTCSYSNGMILLNSLVHADFARYTKCKLLLTTPIFRLENPSNAETPANDVDGDVKDYIAGVKRNGGRVALLYAYRRDFRKGVETYGFLFVGRLLSRLAEMGVSVVFLDPSGEYTEADLDPLGSGNFIHIRKVVDFRALVRMVDLYLRPTSTDGNSVAVLEALDARTPVVASDRIPRPGGVSLYAFEDAASFLKAIEQVLETNDGTAAADPLRPVDDYIDFVRSL